MGDDYRLPPLFDTRAGSVVSVAGLLFVGLSLFGGADGGVHYGGVGVGFIVTGLGLFITPRQRWSPPDATAGRVAAGRGPFPALSPTAGYLLGLCFLLLGSYLGFVYQP